MFDWAIFRERKDFYSGSFGRSYRFDHDHHHVHVSPRDFQRTLAILKHDMGFGLLSDIAVISVSNHPLYQAQYPLAQWDVTYHLFHLEAHQRLQLHLLLGAGEVLPSILDLYPGATRFEREAQERLGESVPTTRALTLPSYPTNPNLSEVPYPEELNQWYLFDLNHPTTRHQFALAVEADDGKIRHSWLQTGYWTRNWEARASELTPVGFAPLLDGLLPEAAPLVSCAWAKTVEDYFLWRIPERAQAIRMILMELSRIASHLRVLGHVAEELGVSEASQVCREMRERIRSVLGFYSGARMTTQATQIGGLAQNLPPGWVQEASSLLRGIDGALGLYRRMVTHHPLARRRLKVAGVTAREALEAGVTGPALRASGVNFDLRKSRPFYFYQDIDFEVPVGIHGEAHDRVLILMEENHQSLRILWQVLDNLPLGEIRIDVPGLDEFLRGQRMVSTWGEWYAKADRAWSAQYTAIEGPSGELGFHLGLGPESAVITSLKIKTNAINLAQSLPTFLRDCPVSELALALSSLNLEASAVDR